MSAHHFKQPKVYQKAFDLAMEIFELTKSFPPEEKFSPTDQIRRSSRSVCASISEAYRKKLYPAHFVSKLTNADMENSETGVWLDFAGSCHYISQEQLQKLTFSNEEIGRMLGHMICNSKNY